MLSIALCSISQKNFQQQTERGKLKLGIFQFWCGKNHWRTWTGRRRGCVCQGRGFSIFKNEHVNLLKKVTYPVGGS